MNRRSTRTHVAIATSAALALALTACGQSEATDAGDGSTIGFTHRQLAGGAWYESLDEGAQAAAEASGATLLTTDAQNDATTQNSNIQTYITQGVDAVIMNPSDPQGVSAGVQALKNADIPLIVVNSNVSPELEKSAYCYIAEDQAATSAKVGEELAKVAAGKVGAGTVKAVIIGGFPSEVVTEIRRTGFLEGYNSVDGAPELDLLADQYGHWAPDQALSAIRDVATANPDLRLIFVESDLMLPGVQSALEELGMWDQMIVGTYDGEMGTVEYMMDNPDGPIFASGANFPAKQGELAVQMAESAISGEPQDEACPGGVHLLETPVYTPANAAEYYDPAKNY